MNYSILQNCLHIPTSSAQLEQLYATLESLPNKVNDPKNGLDRKQQHHEFLRVLRHVYSVYTGELGIGKDRFNTIVLEIAEVDTPVTIEDITKLADDLTRRLDELIAGPFSVEPALMEYTDSKSLHICVSLDSVRDYPGLVVSGTNHRDLSLRLLQELTEETKDIISNLVNFEEDLDSQTTLFVHKSIAEQYLLMARDELYYMNEYYGPASGRFNVKMVLTKPDATFNGRSVEHLMVGFYHDHD